jgi:hypothetical protein
VVLVEPDAPHRLLSTRIDVDFTLACEDFMICSCVVYLMTLSGDFCLSVHR